MSFARPLGTAAQRRIVGPFALCTLIWGSTWFAITTQLGRVPLAWGVTYRFLIAAATMAFVARWRGERGRMDAAAHGHALLVGVAQFALNYLFVYAAEAEIASGLVALMSALLIVPNALFAWLFLRQPVSRRFLGGAALAMAGLAFLFAHELRHGMADPARTWAGIALSLGGVLSASAANVMQASARARALPPLTALAWAMAYGAAIDAVVALATAGPPTLSSEPLFWVGLLYLSLAGSAIAFTLYFALIREIGPGRAGYIGVLIPVIAMLLSTAFEHYRWSVAAVVGAALALAGLAVAMSARRPSRQEG